MDDHLAALRRTHSLPDCRLSGDHYLTNQGQAGPFVGGPPLMAVSGADGRHNLEKACTIAAEASRLFF
jgi:hypothetical protein